MTFDQLAQKMLQFSHITLGPGATSEEIDVAARQLGLQISGDYRKFLIRFGYGGVADFRLHGLGTGVPKYLDLVRVTESERTEAHPHLPLHLLPIMNDGGGNLYCIDTSSANIEPPVVAWWHDAGSDQEPEPMAVDFVTWLAEMLSQRSGNEP